jgi:hypothetical protein
MSEREALRRKILRRAVAIRNECRQYRLDLASYNENYNPGPAIEVDPDGEVGKAEAWAAQVIGQMEKEAER